MVRPVEIAGSVRSLALRLLVFAALVPSPAWAECEDLMPPVAAVSAPGRSLTPDRAGVSKGPGWGVTPDDPGGGAAAEAPLADPGRPVTPEDIVRLRDIGERDAVGLGKGPLAVSPDGRRVAFVIARAEIAKNDYCRALVVLDLVARARPHIVDRGGEFMGITAPVRGLVLSPGAPEAVTPVWSPDGRSIAYRKRIDGRTEAWLAHADGSGARRVARLAGDVDDMVWSDDGARLLLAWRPGLAQQRDALAEEALSGYLYDERFLPAYQAGPMLTGAPLAGLSVDPATGLAEPLAPIQTERLFPDFRAGVPVPLEARSLHGRQARLRRDTDTIRGDMRIVADDARGRPVACGAAACTGLIKRLFWIGQDLVYLRLEGWARGTYALYRWRPGKGPPQRILATEELLYGCVPAGVEVLCLIEHATSPRMLATIDPANGRRRVLFDPNPEFRVLRLGEVDRIKVRNDSGFEAWADLLLPPGYGGNRIPLVVVQYRSRGFLRGGVGADYPVHAFAAHGLAVLSFERPEGVGDAAKTESEMLAMSTRAWADRWSVQDALERAIAEAIRLGVADPARIGLTGVSDGATTASFALINSRVRFAAVALSTCCMEPGMVATTGGPRFAEAMQAQGYPPIGADDLAFWAPMSLARNASRIDAPILMLEADREYALALETWAALKHAGKPVEMVVYPDEYHNKWQPAHLYANYLRSLDWFDFWLSDRRDPDPAKAVQYRRWDALKALRDRTG